jgi:hypothetical protein
MNDLKDELFGLLVEKTIGIEDCREMIKKLMTHYIVIPKKQVENNDDSRRVSLAEARDIISRELQGAAEVLCYGKNFTKGYNTAHQIVRQELR